MPRSRVTAPAPRRRSTLVRHAVTIAGAFGAGLIVATPAMPFAPTGVVQRVSAAAEPMTLIRQDLALEPDATLEISFKVSTPIAPTDSIVVGAYRPVDGRAGVTAAIDGEYGRSVDSVRIDPAAIATAEDGTLTISVPSESASATLEALRFSSVGLHPVTVDVENAEGELMSEMLTFVDRLPVTDGADSTDSTATDPSPADRAEGRLTVAIAASISADPLIPGEDTPLPAVVNDQIAELSTYPAGVPLTVSISPDVLARVDPKSLEELRPVLANSSLLSQPSIPLDPSSAAAAGQEELFTDLLQLGEDETVQLVGVQPERTVWLEDRPLTVEGAALLRSRGVNLVVLSPQTYAAAGLDGGFFGGYTLYSQLRSLQLPEDAVVPAAITDPDVTRYLTDAALAPEMAALYTAAELVAWNDWLATEFPETRNSTVLSMPGGGVLGPDRVTRLVEMATATGAVTFEQAGDIVGSTDFQLQDGVPAPLTLAPQQLVDLSERVEVIDAISVRRNTIAGMLVEDRGRSDLWARTIRTLESSSITDAQVDATIKALDAEFDLIVAGIVGPEPFTFRMNGESTTLHVKIVNQGPETLRMKLRLSSTLNKIEFPQNDIAVEVPSGPPLDVEVPVRARANGTATILVEVLAPDGTSLDRDTLITAKVNALTGLAQVLTGGMALILATWWVRNLRRNRRTQRAAVALDNHPARPKTPSPTVLAATAAIPAEPGSDATHGTNAATASTATTATTSTATITAATVIAGLDTTTPDPAAAEPGSTTLSDS